MAYKMKTIKELNQVYQTTGRPIKVRKGKMIGKGKKENKFCGGY